MRHFLPVPALPRTEVNGWLRRLRRWAWTGAVPLCMAAPQASACSGVQSAQCARASASAELQRLDALADASRLYQPERAMPSGFSGTDEAPLLQMGSGPVLRDYLARQLDRVHFLAAQAQGLMELLASTSAVDDGSALPSEQLAYWRATVDELIRYTRGDDGGQVGGLHGFMARAAQLTPANCRQKLAADSPAVLGNDLFSRHRRQLVEMLQRSCADLHAARWHRLYQPLALRFNQDLAGRYPFAPAGGREAAGSAMKDFFADYAGARDGLMGVLRGFGSRCLVPQRAFLESLDTIAAVMSDGGSPRPVAGSAPWPGAAPLDFSSLSTEACRRPPS